MEFPKAYMKLGQHKRAAIIRDTRSMVESLDTFAYPNITRAISDRDGKIEIVFLIIAKTFGRERMALQKDVLQDIETSLVED